MVKHVERQFAGRPLKLEAGRLAKQAAGSCLLQFGETVVLRVWTTRIGDSSFTLRYEMRVREDGRLAAEGESVQVAYDYETKRAKLIPDYFRKALEAEMADPH